MKIIQISQNENGDWYVMYQIPVQRGIKGKTKSKVNEVLIVGIPGSKFDSWCKKNNLVVRKESVDGKCVEVFVWCR